MPAAVNRSELLAVTHGEYAKLVKLLDRVDERDALAKRDDDTSIKDIVGHRAHWIELFLDWYARGMEGREVHFPAEGYKWSELKRFNADLRARQSDLTWSDAVKLLADNHARLVRFIEERSDADLYGGPMAGANNAWTPGRWAEAAGPSHYRSASKFIRSCLRTPR